jgi:DegV family protein with EDD domain
MHNICILTDNTAQFSSDKFPGRDRVYTVPLDLETFYQTQGRPAPASNGHSRKLLPPSPQTFIRHYDMLGSKYDAVLVLTLSTQLIPAAENARQAALLHNNHIFVEVIDSQSTAAGLGMLVEAAAGVASRGGSLNDVERIVRAATGRIYMLMCIPEMKHLEVFGLLTHTQAMVGEMLGMLPIMFMEEGQLVPLEKAHTPRHLFETFEEFLDEFSAPERVALLRGTGHTTTRTRPLRQYVHENFPDAKYNEHPFNTPLSALFGPQSIGIVVMEPA